MCLYRLTGEIDYICAYIKCTCLRTYIDECLNRELVFYIRNLYVQFYLKKCLYCQKASYLYIRWIGKEYSFMWNIC